MTYAVEITESCIAGQGCPIERAIREQTPFGAHVGDVSMTLWHTDWNGSRQLLITYNRALDFIKRCDAKKSVKPFRFEFEI